MMCYDNTYGLPLALVMEEILEWEKPASNEDKEEETKQEQTEGRP